MSAHVDFPFCNASAGQSPAFQLLRAISPLLDLHKGPWVAGGAIRRILTHAEHEDFDIDVFFSGEDQMRKVGPALRAAEKKWREDNGGQEETHFLAPARAFEAATHGMEGLVYAKSTVFVPLQLISRRYYATPYALIDDIDFTICQMVTDGVTVLCPHRSLNDLHERRLRIAPTSVVRNNTRIFRYFTYGFEPDETVMKIAQEIPRTSYYNVGGEGYKAFESLRQRLMIANLEHNIILGKLADVIIERDCGVGVAYIYGRPFPAPVAYLYISCPEMREDIDKFMAEVWEQHGLGKSDYTKHPPITPMRFFEAYRQAYRDYGE